MKKHNLKATLLTLSTFGIGLLAAPNAHAQDKDMLNDHTPKYQISSTVAVGTDYIWRGVSQTDGRPAISGSVDLSTDIGFYAGVWASNVDFDDNDIEVDFYAGISREIGDFSLDLGIIYYLYDEKGFDLTELYISVGYSFLTASIHPLIDSDAGENFGDKVYYSLDGDWDLTTNMSLTLHAGYYDHKASDDSYFDCGLYLSFSEVILKNSNLSAGVTYTDQDGDDPALTVVYSYTF